MFNHITCTLLSACELQKYDCRKDAKAPVVASKDDREFTFADYLTNPRPDIIIIAPSLHDNYRLTNTTFIERQLELMDRFVSNTTRLVLVPFHYVAIARMRYEFQKALNFHGENGERIRRDEWTRQINTILYRLASKRFINGRHLLLIPNLEQASRYITDHNADGLHMEQNWYQHILSAIVQHLCDM